jgi:glycosyltransferase involved in cell wall biosynthesis
MNDIGDEVMGRRLRITQVVHDFHPVVGGIETYAYNLAKGLVDAGHHVKVYTARLPGLPDYECWEGIHIFRFRSVMRPFSYPFIPALIPALTRDQSDVLHAHINSPMTVDFTAFSSRLVGIPLVITYHADALITDLAVKPPVLRRWLSQVYWLSRHAAANIAKHLIVTSPIYLESSPFLQRYRDKISVIPASVNPYYLTPLQDTRQAKESFGFSPDHPLILFVGRLVPYKGLRVLLRAFHQIHNQLPNAQLAIVGTGPQHSHLQEMSQKIGLATVVHFLGVLPQSRLRDMYSACDVFVLPSRSRSEAFGIVLLEAMARGKPVVATHVGGIPYVVEDRTTGILVPPYDPVLLRKAILDLLQDTRLRQRLGEAGRKRVLKHFTRQPTTQQLEQLYLNLLS